MMKEVVIKIPEELYNEYMIIQLGRGNGKGFVSKLLKAIKDGVPLPENHGRLIDADETLATACTNFYKHEDEWQKKDKDYLPIGRIYDQNGFECCQQTIINAPTIIEATGKEVENDTI